MTKDSETKDYAGRRSHVYLRENEDLYFIDHVYFNKYWHSDFSLRLSRGELWQLYNLLLIEFAADPL